METDNINKREQEESNMKYMVKGHLFHFSRKYVCDGHNHISLVRN